MSQTAVRIVPSTDTAATATPVVSLEGLVDRYISTTFERFERVLLAQLPALVEPAVTDPGRSMRKVGSLVETLVGFAIGSAFGCVASAVRRSFGKQVRDAIDTVIGKLKHGPVLQAVPDVSNAPRFFARPEGDEKPLLDELGSQLQARLCHAAAEARRHVNQIQQTIARVAPEQLGFFANTLNLLVTDDAAALAFTDQLSFGWTHCVAAMTKSSAPVMPSAPRWQRSSGLWRSWFEKVTGAPVLAELTQEQVVAAGFVMRIG